jgi:4-nitrophenyl phosphatase
MESNIAFTGAVKNLIIDMDGVLWRGETPMAGLVEFFAALGELELGYILATNNATKTAAQYSQKLARLGVDVPAARILTSSEATAAYLRQEFPAGSRAYLVGEAGLRDALDAAGLDVSSEPLDVLVAPDGRLPEPPPLVVVGLNRRVCYAELATAAVYIARGARFVATNPDPSLPSEWGQLPGAGALLAFLTTTTGVEPTVVGKPGRILFEEALRRLNGSPSNTAMVGDRLTTDVAGAQRAGLRTVLLLSGVATLGDVAAGAIKPEWIFEDIAALTEALVNSHRSTVNSQQSTTKNQP